MSYFEQQEKLAGLIKKMYMDKKVPLNSDFPVSIFNLGDKLDITMDEIGGICELVYKILSGNQTIKSTETALIEILDETNRENMGVISAFINNDIINKIKSDLYGTKSDLVPEAQEKVRPATVSAPEDVVNTVPQINEAIYEKISREQILRDLENPPPAKFSTGENKDVNENKKTEPKTASAPQNLPIEEPAIQEGEREVPIVRTMQRDIAKQSGEELKTVKAPALENTEKMFNLPRGKFGSGSVPQIKQLKISSNSVSVEKIPPSKNISIETPKKIETPVPTPKPISVPTPQPQINIEKVKSTSNPLEDKLTKMVHIPMENKKYEVDPYRESLDN